MEDLLLKWWDSLEKNRERYGYEDRAAWCVGYSDDFSAYCFFCQAQLSHFKNDEHKPDCIFPKILEKMNGIYGQG